MREMMFSMMKFSGAVTMFSMEQAQNAMMAPADTRTALIRLCRTLDAMSNSLASKLDGPKKAALDGMTKSQMAILDSTPFFHMDAVNMDAASDFMKKTSESLGSMMKSSSNGRHVNGKAA
jgi:hypothetical protein